MHDSKPAANALIAGFVVVGALFAGIGLVYTILTSRGNDLSEFAKYLALIGFVAGFVNPRGMIFPFIITTAYLDLLKRLLILYDRPTFMDLFYVLGISPLMLAGITLGTLVGAWFGKIPFDRRHFGLMILSSLFILFSGLLAFRQHGVQEAVKSVADIAGYSVLLFVIPVLFPTWKQLWPVLRFVIIAFIPVGLYTFYQHFNGLSAFEVEYLKSGLTIMVKELDDVRPRPFSTLNSAHSLAYASSILAVLCCIPLVTGRHDPVAGRHPWRFTVLGLFYLAVCFLSMGRSGHLVWIVAGIAILTFTSKRRTLAIYGTALTGYATLIVFAEWFLVKLPVWDSHLAKGTPLLVQATRIQTFSERLRGYQALKDWNNYSLFGVDHFVFTHDVVTQTLIQYGLVPLLFVFALGTYGLVRLHREILRLPSGAPRRLACLLFGIALGVIAGAILFGGVAAEFPVNAFMWISIGGLVMLAFHRQNLERPLAEPAPVPVPAPPTRTTPPEPELIPAIQQTASPAARSNSPIIH